MGKYELLKLLEKYKRDNANKYGIVELGVFGSAARDEMTSKSDIDIVIKTETPDPFKIIHIKEDLENIFNCPVDIVRYRESMNYLLQERIDRDAVYV